MMVGTVTAEIRGDLAAPAIPSPAFPQMRSLSSEHGIWVEVGGYGAAASQPERVQACLGCKAVGWESRVDGLRLACLAQLGD